MSIQSYKGYVSLHKGNIAFLDRDYFVTHIRQHVSENAHNIQGNAFGFSIDDVVDSIVKTGMQIQNTSTKFMRISVPYNGGFESEYTLSGFQYRKLCDMPFIWDESEVAVDVHNITSRRLPVQINSDDEFPRAFSSYIANQVMDIVQRPKDYDDPAQLELYRTRLKGLLHID